MGSQRYKILSNLDLDQWFITVGVVETKKVDNLCYSIITWFITTVTGWKGFLLPCIATVSVPREVLKPDLYFIVHQFCTTKIANLQAHNTSYHDAM